LNLRLFASFSNANSKPLPNEPGIRNDDQIMLNDNIYIYTGYVEVIAGSDHVIATLTAGVRFERYHAGT
jgi:hypothetical protein